MPESLQPTWDAIHNEVIAVHGRWIIYRQLFAKSPERIGILNECAASFFYVLQETLLNDVQLTLSKLADPAKTRGRSNATLRRLLDEITELNKPLLTDELSQRLADYEASCMKIKTRRNKQIAHYDHATLLLQYASGPSDPLGPSRQEIENALAALRDFMNSVESSITSSETAYQHFISKADGEALISVLKQGLRYRQLQIAGSIPWDDLGA